MPKFISITSLKATQTPDCYSAEVVIEWDNGTQETVPYGVVPGDMFGVAPDVHVAVAQWIADGKPIEPADAPADPPA